MKQSIIFNSLCCITLLLVSSALGQETDLPPLPPETEASTPPVLDAVPVPLSSTTFSATGPESLRAQEQFKWIEQRTYAAEEQARSAQRMVPLVILLMLFALPLAFAGGLFFARYKQYQCLNQTLRGLIERGVPIPPEILTPVAPKGPGVSDFRKGLLLIWTGVGAALLLAIILRGTGAWGLGLIPIFSGLAYLALGKLERRKQIA